MQVLNTHSRTIRAPVEESGILLGALGSASDRLWPVHAWPPMRLDRPLQVGATGGHGPIRYTVESYEPGRAVTFRFTSPRGFHGTHCFTVTGTKSGSVLSHTISMSALGVGVASWLLVFRPLHDALLEDALTNAERALTGKGNPVLWSPYVRCLRAILRRRKSIGSST